MLTAFQKIQRLRAFRKMRTFSEFDFRTAPLTFYALELYHMDSGIASKSIGKKYTFSKIFTRTISLQPPVFTYFSRQARSAARIFCSVLSYAKEHVYMIRIRARACAGGASAAVLRTAAEKPFR